MGKRIPAAIKCKNCACYTIPKPYTLNKDLGIRICSKYHIPVYEVYQFPECFVKKDGDK